VTNAVLIKRAVSCWHLHQLISQTTQYLDSWLSDLLQGELKMKLLEVEGGTCPSALAGDATDWLVATRAVCICCVKILQVCSLDEVSNQHVGTAFP